MRICAITCGRSVVRSAESGERIEYFWRLCYTDRKIRKDEDAKEGGALCGKEEREGVLSRRWARRCTR